MIKKSILFVLFLIPTLLFAERTKVACVGNSVTYGYKIDDRAFTYPAQLQQLLSNTYRVENFGHSGATLLQKGHNPYRKLKVFEQALAFEPDIVVIHLGLNDTDPRNWPKFRDDFTRDYIDLIRSFQEKNPATKVWICRMTPIFSWHPRFKSSTRVWYEQVQQEIERVAAVTRVPLIDLNRPLYNRPDLFPDALHPTTEGAGIIARTVYGAITGDYGSLQMPEIFTDHMVMQRNRPVKFWGTADAATKVTVCFAGKTSTAQTGHNGKWTVEFPQMKAGGPYNATIENQGRSIRLTDILVGEVWICSGQSNMAFRLQDASTAQKDIPRAANRQLRFFDMKEIAPTVAIEWNDNVLAEVNRLGYYRPAAWALSDSLTARQFSAVAYYFGRMLQEELNVPIGLIQNAIGGSPTEAWIDRRTMERDPLMADFFTNWNSNDFIDGWVRERGMQNIARAKENPLQQHPYKPSYLFEAGMVVSSDLGNRTDVHPRQKKEVGERLARWALADSYGKNILKSGPLFREVFFEKEKAVVTFSETKLLRTSDNNAVRNIELAGEDKVFYQAKAMIRANRLEVTCEKVSRPAFVRYGWDSYTEGNLVNEAGLPASTFSSEFQDKK